MKTSEMYASWIIDTFRFICIDIRMEMILALGGQLVDEESYLAGYWLAWSKLHLSYVCEIHPCS